MSYRRDVEDRMENPNLLRDLGINRAVKAEPAKTEAMITYAHKADASRSTRFRAFATDALPVWAVDIRPEPAKTEASECESGAILRQNGFFSTPPTPEADPQALLGWTRYEKARKLNPAQWAELHQRNLRGENFDNMIDALPASTQPVQQDTDEPDPWALRFKRALLAIKYNAVSLADAQVIALRALNGFDDSPPAEKQAAPSGEDNHG